MSDDPRDRSFGQFLDGLIEEFGLQEEMEAARKELQALTGMERKALLRTIFLPIDRIAANLTYGETRASAEILALAHATRVTLRAKIGPECAEMFDRELQAARSLLNLPDAKVP